MFIQYHDHPPYAAEKIETTHVALVKLHAPESLGDKALEGLGQTLTQLSRLSMFPCVVVDSCIPSDTPLVDFRRKVVEQAERLVAAIDANPGQGARRLENILRLSEADGKPAVLLRELLLRPLRRGQIPVVLPIAYVESIQRATRVTANDTVLALTKELAGLNLKPTPEEDPDRTGQHSKALQKAISVDRLIILDSQGAIPLPNLGENHVFINLQQEYDDIRAQLQGQQNAATSADHPRHLQNLDVVRDALSYLPPTSSALITSPSDAARSNSSRLSDVQASGIRTRQQKNSLIYNLLTDKAAHSSSLPAGRLGTIIDSKTAPAIVASTFIKKGMPLTILPDPRKTPWIAENRRQPRLKLTDPRIDLPRLAHLIDDSFNRKLDVEHYLRRVNNRIAGVIIAGEYEGGALLTWELPPGVPDDDSPATSSRLVPYLDKFAVLKRSQGAGGVADILFNAMVRSCFPQGVCWRSRRDNPVNKWYFERAKGTWKMPNTNWTLFFTTEGIDEQTFLDYQGVCRSVEPSWADHKQEVD